jgi:transposase
MSKSIASRKRASKKTQDRKIKFLPEEKVHVGLDVHKRTYTVTLWSTQRDSMVTRWTQPANPDALIRSLAPYKERIDHAVYEAGPTGYGLVRALRDVGCRADVIAPSRTPKTTGQEAKSDRIDSRKLAMWSAKNLLRAVAVPTPEEEGDREVFRSRDDAVKKRRRIKQQIKSFLLRYGVDEPTGLKDWALKAIAALREMELSPSLRFTLDMLLGDLDHCDSQVKKADAALRKLASTERHKKKVEALRTVPGVGPVTAMAIRTELIDPERFDNGRQVAAMAGLAPLVSRTGERTRQGPLMKCGNARLRTILIESAWRWMPQDPWAGETYRRLARNTGDKKKAIAALARRLVIILWRISVTGEPYRPRPCAPDESGESAAERKPRQPGLPTKEKRTKRTPSNSRRRPLVAQLTR